jgi:hypothetical protein
MPLTSPVSRRQLTANYLNRPNDVAGALGRRHADHRQFRDRRTGARSPIALRHPVHAGVRWHRVHAWRAGSQAQTAALSPCRYEGISRFGQSPQLGIILFRPWRRSAQHKGSKRTAFNSPWAKSLLLNKRLPTASYAFWEFRCGGDPILDCSAPKKGDSNAPFQRIA